MHDLLKDLNDQQRQAVTAPLGPVLVLAGAGSGKTRALTYRIAWLIREKLFRREEILALTFTNKAAGEMKNRINKILNVEGRMSNLNSAFSILNSSLTMGTFHSVCVRILRQDIEKLDAGYDRNFTIYDADDSLKLIKQIILELGLAEHFRPQVFSYYISACKNKLIIPEKLSLENDFLAGSIRKVYDRYQSALRELNALDFDDLLGFVYQLFKALPEVLKKYQNKFKYVLVDEYQDTNHVQYELLKLLVAHSTSLRATTNNIFVVGDDAQSIYGFRGANMKNILDFKKDYPKAKVIMLEQNYRSSKPILDVANKVIGLNPFQYEKKLWTDIKKGEKVNLYEAQDEGDEARFVIRTVMSPSPNPSHQGRGIKNNSSPLVGEARWGGDSELTYESEETSILDRFMNKRFRFSNIPYSIFHIPDNLREQVILYRTHAQSRAFEEVLIGAGVPYQIVGGIKFYERREIKDAVAFLRLVLNPKDLVSMERVINLPVRGIGRAAFKEITKGLQKYDYNFTRLHLNVEVLGLASKALAGAREFFGLYSHPSLTSPGLRPPSPRQEREIRNRLSPPIEGREEKGDEPSDSSPLVGEARWGVMDIMNHFLTRSGYKDALMKEGKEGEMRWENIEELYNVGAKFKHLPGHEGLTAFLEEVALMTDLDSMEEEGNKLTLMTLHSAKGLEFDKVFLVGLEEGLLPHSRSLGNSQEVAEEVRLAYVGVTRAKKDLYLTYARQRQHYGEIKRTVPSRILKAIPKNLINKIDPTNPDS